MTRPYYDSDVERDPSLREIAEEYVADYTGRFLPVLQAKERMKQGVSLDVTHIRLVLNAMRSDMTISGMPEPSATVTPIRKGVNYTIQADSVFEEPNDFPRQMSEYDIVNPDRPVVLDRWLRVKRDYGTSWVRNALNIHIVDHANSKIRWHSSWNSSLPDRYGKYGKGNYDFANRAPDVRIRYLCSSFAKSTMHMELLMLETAQLLVSKGIRKQCKQCWTIKEKA
jgi:hypothetical protein